MKKLYVPIRMLILSVLVLLNLYLLRAAADTENAVPPGNEQQEYPVSEISPQPEYAKSGKVFGRFCLPEQNTANAPPYPREGASGAGTPAAESASGKAMDYVLCIPEDASPGMPLLVFLHGDGFVRNYDGLKNHGIITRVKSAYNGERFPFLLLIPHTDSYSWIRSDVSETLLGLIDYIIDEYGCNPDKVMLTGHSRGAIGTWYYVSEYPQRFSCAVPVSSGYDGPFNWKAAAEVPIRAYAGRNIPEINAVSDDNYNYTLMSGMVHRLKAYGGDALIFPLFGNSHDQTQYSAYEFSTFDWMLGQDRSKR